MADMLTVGFDDALEFHHLIERELTGVAATRAFAVQRTDLDANAACSKRR
jgi:hypothetical protein